MNFSHQYGPLLDEIEAESSFYKSTPCDVCNVQADDLVRFSLLSARFGGGYDEQHYALPFYRFTPEIALNFIISLSEH